MPRSSCRAETLARWSRGVAQKSSTFTPTGAGSWLWWPAMKSVGEMRESSG